jgi:hypothetical protein
VRWLRDVDVGHGLMGHDRLPWVRLRHMSRPVSAYIIRRRLIDWLLDVNRGMHDVWLWVHMSRLLISNRFDKLMMERGIWVWCHERKHDGLSSWMVDDGLGRCFMLIDDRALNMDMRLDSWMSCGDCMDYRLRVFVSIDDRCLLVNKCWVRLDLRYLDFLMNDGL